MPAVTAAPDCAAARAMRELNPNALVALVDGEIVAIEDAWDCPEDGRLYKIEYRSTPDGLHSVAWCLSNPWDRARPDAGVAVHLGHVFPDGLICLGPDHARAPAQSPRCLRDTVLRARFWCLGFSSFKERGTFPSP